MGTPIHPSPHISGLRGFISELQKVVLRSSARRFSCRGRDGRSLRHRVPLRRLLYHDEPGERPVWLGLEVWAQNVRPRSLQPGLQLVRQALARGLLQRAEQIGWFALLSAAEPDNARPCRTPKLGQDQGFGSVCKPATELPRLS